MVTFMRKGAIGLLQLLVIVAILSGVFTFAIVSARYAMSDKSTAITNVENGLISKPLN